jgi:hypothetical protein
LVSFAQRFLRHGCYVCYCAVLKCVDVVIILTMYAPLTVGSSPCLCSYVIDRSVYVDVFILFIVPLPFQHTQFISKLQSYDTVVY